MPEAAVIQKFYLVERIHLWKAIQPAEGGAIAFDTKAIGFCPVFESEDEAKKAFPGEDIHVLVVSFIPKPK